MNRFCDKLVFLLFIVTSTDLDKQINLLWSLYITSL